MYTCTYVSMYVYLCVYLCLFMYLCIYYVRCMAMYFFNKNLTFSPAFMFSETLSKTRSRLGRYLRLRCSKSTVPCLGHCSSTPFTRHGGCREIITCALTTTNTGLQWGCIIQLLGLEYLFNIVAWSVEVYISASSISNNSVILRKYGQHNISLTVCCTQVRAHTCYME